MSRHQRGEIASVRAIGDAWAPGTIAAAVWSGRRYAEEFDADLPGNDGVPFPARGHPAARGPGVSAADWLFHGGAVHVGEPSPGTADALAVTGNRIAALGDEAIALRGPRTEVVDLAGGALLPGFQDAHIHAIVGGLQQLGCDLAVHHNLEDYRKAISDFSDEHPRASGPGRRAEPAGVARGAARGGFGRGSGRGRFRASAVKIMQDGVCENLTAAVVEPTAAPGREREGRASSTGRNSPRSSGSWTARGFDVHMHAVGDRAVRECLDALARCGVLRAPAPGRAHRPDPAR